MRCPGKTCREGIPSRWGIVCERASRSAVASLLGLTLLLASIGRAHGAIVFVKNIGTSSSATTGTTISVTVPAAGIATGNSITLTLALGAVSGTISAADTAGNTYAIAADVTNASRVRTVILSAHNVAPLVSGNTITVTHPSVAARALSANEF